MPVRHVLTALLAAVACDPDNSPADEVADEVADEDDESADDAREAASPPANAVDTLTDAVDGTKLVIQGTSYTWHQGGPIVYMGSKQDVVCWLIEIGGDFEGHDEFVKIRAETYGDRWYMSGGSEQSGVMATAHCIPRAYFGQTLAFSEHNWRWGDATEDLGPAHQRVCFLSGMEGKFEGSGEYVRTYVANGRWYLGGGSQQPSPADMAASAVCMNTGWLAGPFHWAQGQTAVKMASAVEWACGLSRVTGKFEGAGEKVRTPVLGDGWWYLTGTSQQSGVGGSAYCI